MQDEGLIRAGGCSTGPLGKGQGGCAPSDALDFEPEDILQGIDLLLIRQDLTLMLLLELEKLAFMLRLQGLEPIPVW